MLSLLWSAQKLPGGRSAIGESRLLRRSRGAADAESIIQQLAGRRAAVAHRSRQVLITNDRARRNARLWPEIAANWPRAQTPALCTETALMIHASELAARPIRAGSGPVLQKPADGRDSPLEFGPLVNQTRRPARGAVRSQVQGAAP